MLMLAALLDYVWVRVNNMKMAHEVTTKSKDPKHHEEITKYTKKRNSKIV